MKRNIWIGIVCVGMVMLLAWGATRVGSVGIRRVKPIDEETTLSVSLPAVPGIETVVHWNIPADHPNVPVNFHVRVNGEVELVGQAHFNDATAKIVFPCIAGASTATLVMDDKNTEQVLAHTSINMLPAGPDCIR